MAVYNRSKEALLQASELVRTETLESANSAERVGLLFYDITEHILDVEVTPKYPDGLNSVLVADIVVAGLNNLIYAPKGGGGGGEISGYQKVYFANVTSGTVPLAPQPSDYNSGLDAFDLSTPTWVRTNVNPLEGLDTYAIWVYFNANDNIVTIDGPVCLTGAGSNGEDGEEIEWIYFRVQNELEAGEISIIQNYLETCKGNTAAKYWNGSTWVTENVTFEHEDAVPLNGGWEDNALGINEDLQYEYAAFRRSKNNSNGERTWGDDYFHGPLLWSAYGKQGMDGDGIEYIFYADRDGSPSWGTGDYPPYWTNDEDFQTPEYIRTGSRWTDDPINIETLSMGAKLWCCIRKKQNEVWQAYSPPVLWSYYAKDGVSDAYTTDIVNENMPVGTDNEGTATNYTNHGRIQAFHNEDTLQYTSTVGTGGYPAEGYFTYTIGNITRSDDPNHIALGITAAPNLSDGALFDVVISSVSNFANINAYIPITVKLPNGTEQYLECTLYGVATGEAGQAIDIWTNADVIRDNDTGLGTAPAQLQIGVKIGRGEDVHTYYSGGVPSAESMNFYFGYRYDDGQMQALTPGTLTLESNHSTLTIEMRQGNSFAEGHFVDSEDIPYIKNGATITNIQPYYRAVASESLKPGTNGYSDISLNDSPTVEGTTFGSNYPFLYRRDYYTFSDGVSYFGVTVFDRRYFEPVRPTYTISTINDNAVIDDLTTTLQALETATLNPITVYLGNNDVTSSCHYKVTSSNLPAELKLQTKNGSTYTDISLNSRTSVNLFVLAPTSSSVESITPGNYYYDILVEEASKTKRFKLYVNENISIDGSFYKLLIEHDTISYDSIGSRISDGNPKVTAYKYALNGGSELLTLNVTTTVPTSESDTIYLVVGSTLNSAASSSVGLTITFDADDIPYNANGYEVSLYRGKYCVDGPEKIDCTKLRSGEAAYIISTINDSAVIDDQTISLVALETATLNPITVYLGNNDVTSECHYKITSLVLPTGLKLQTKSGNSYSDIVLNGRTTIGTFVIAPDSPSSRLQPGNYYYDVLVEEALKTKRFKLYVDENVSVDGSFYKLHIEHDTLNYDASNNLISSGNPTVTAYRYPLGGGSELLTLNVTTSVPLAASDTMYLVVGNVLNSAKTSSSGTSITFSANSISYSSTGYELSLYRGNLRVDGPEKIDCTKLEVESEEAAYVIATINDNAAIDDLTTSDSALRIATLNPITVYKGNENVTSSCTFDILNKTLNTLELDVESTTDSSYPNSKVYHIVKKNSSLTKFTPGSYSYDIKVSDSNYNEIGRKRFKLYIDKDISTDGSFYKLEIRNDTIMYDSDGEAISTDIPTALAYKVPLSGDPTLLNITVTRTVPSSASENLYIVVDDVLWNAKKDSYGQSIGFDVEDIPYKADKYEITLYKGNKYQDGPEYIDCTKDVASGIDGYSLVTNPSYIIIDELISSQGVTDSSGVVTYYALTLTANELKQQYAIIKVLKGKTPLVINYNSFNTTIGAATIVDASTGGTVSSSTTALKVYLTSVPQKTASSSPTGWNQSEGKITFTVTLGGSSFYSVEIPVYINRLGTRLQTIAGDVETTMMSKTAYIDTNGNPVKWRDLGTYVRSSQVNISQLETQVEELTRSISKILQTSDAISLSVYAGLRTLYFRDTELTVSSGSTRDIYLSRYDKVSTTTFPPNGVYTVRYSADVFLDSRVTNGYVGVSFYYELEDETSDYYMELEYAANKVGRWVSIEGFENMTSKIIGFDTSLEYIFDLYNSTGYTAKIKNVRVELVTTDSKTLYGAGIDISAGRIDMLADNFTLRNNKDEQTLGVDSFGNVQVSGTIKGNIYRSVCILSGWESTLTGAKAIFYSTDWYYCKSITDDRTEEGDYQIGKYYLGNSDIWSNSDFVLCTYLADMLLITDNGANWWPENGPVHIPRALDFPGKMLEVRNYGSQSALLYQVDNAQRFAKFYIDGYGKMQLTTGSGEPLSSVVLASNSSITLISMAFNNVYYWLRIYEVGGLSAQVNLNNTTSMTFINGLLTSKT